MKLLSVAIPCYNSAAYMEKCIKSLLPGGKYVEIIIVDDGSSRTIPRASRMNTPRNIRISSRRSIRKTAGTAKP